MVLGNLTCFVQVSEPVERFEGGLAVVGLIEAVELLQSLPDNFSTRVRVEKLPETFSVRDGEMVASLEQTVPGSKAGPAQTRVSLRAAGGVAVLCVPG